MFSTVFLVPGGMSRMTQLAQRRKGTSCQPPTASSPWQTPQRRLRAPSQVFKSPNADGNDSHWALGPCSRDRMRSTVKTTTMPLMLQGLDVQGMSTLDARQLLQLASYYYLRKGLGGGRGRRNYSAISRNGTKQKLFRFLTARKIVP